MEAYKPPERYITKTDADGNLLTTNRLTGVWHKRDRAGRLLDFGIVRPDAMELLAAIQKQDREKEAERGNEKR
jgi:hypothetical protein